MSEHDREPRPGLLPGVWDRLVGPGATQTENAGTVAAAILGAAIGVAGDPPAVFFLKLLASHAAGKAPTEG